MHPFDHVDVIAGQGTVGLEIVEQCPEVATVLVPLGGGGLLGGIAAALPEGVRVVGVQAAGADVLIVNKTDLAPYVGVDVEQMVLDASTARDVRTVIALSRTDPESIARLRRWVLDTLAEFRAGSLRPRTSASRWRTRRDRSTRAGSGTRARTST